MKFKIFYGEEARRFTLEKSPSWCEFWELLSNEIFSRKEDFHKELYLQYTDLEGDNITVSTSTEYDEMLNHFPADSLIKLNIVEGTGSYFKDGPAPIPIALYQKREPLSGLYNTFINTSQGTWIAWEPLSISNSHDLVTLSTFLIYSPHFTENSLSWEGKELIDSSSHIVDNENQNVNHTSGEFKFDDNGTSFEGLIQFHSHIPLNLPILYNQQISIKGVLTKHVEEENLKKEGYVESVKERVPLFLQSLFKEGKILPHHIPDWLSSAILIKPIIDEENHEDPIVDLDIDINKLYLAIHSKALELLDSKQYEKAEEYFLTCIEINPSSQVAQYNLACVYSLSGKYSLSVNHLQRAIDLGYSDITHLLSDSDLLPLHSYLPFIQLTQSLSPSS